MKKWMKALCTLAVAFAAFLVTTTVAFAATPKDATKGLKLGDLYEDGLLKLNGRIRLEDDYLSGDYSGVGFSTVIRSEGEELEVYVDTNYTSQVSIFVDGEYATTQMVYGSSTNHGMVVTCDITAGEHEITVVKENVLTTSTSGYFHFTDIRFEGTVERKVADKELLVEVIGDSYSCGCEVTVPYRVGIGATDDRIANITKSFGWFLSKMLDADFREVGRGGQGLDGTAAQEEQTNTVTMPVLYNYFNYKEQSEGKAWTDTRKADLIIIELGANDSSTAKNQASWVAIAKNFLLKLKQIHGEDTPIVWDFTTNKSYLYAGLRNALENDAELSAYDDIYLMLNYLEGNGMAANASQTAGHPDEPEQYQHAERLYSFIQTEGVLGVEETESAHQYVYYVSETGNDNNDGLTAETAKLTVNSAVTAGTIAVKALSSVPADAEIVIRVTGEVKLTEKQSFLSYIDGKSKLITRKDGTILPYVIETNQYDGTNRATLRSEYQPTASGAATSYSIAPLVFKDVKLFFVKGASYTVSNLYVQYGDLTFDNTIIETGAGTKVGVYANNFSYNSGYHSGIAAGTEQRTHTITFKNGYYGASTGFNRIGAVGGVDRLYVSKDNYKYAEPGLTTEVVLGDGAVVDGTILRTVNSLLSVKEAILTVKTGAKVEGNFTGTLSGTSDARKSITADVTINVEGGHFKGAFSFLGSYLDITGNQRFRMTGGEIYVPGGTTEAATSVQLNGGYQQNTSTGDAIVEISGGMIYVVAVASKSIQSAIQFSGRSTQVITGTSLNVMTAGAILVVPSDSSAFSTGSTVFFGPYGGCIQTELRNEIRGGIIDVSQISSTNIHFGVQTTKSAIQKLTNIIGVETEGTRSQGPVMLAGTIRLGSIWGQFGRDTYEASAVSDASAITSDTVVMSHTIYGGRFIGDVRFAQTGDTAAHYMRTEGSLDINVYGGRFEGTTYIVSTGSIYGHVTANLEGGFFRTIYGIAGSTALITDGLEVHIGDIYSYGSLAKSSSDSTLVSTYEIRFLSNGKIQALSGKHPALRVTVTGGSGNSKLTFSDSNNILGGAAVEVSVTGGKYHSITGAKANGAVSGGWYAVAPEAALLASGCTVTDFAATVDQLYTCYVSQDSSEAAHTHCVCAGNAVGKGAHVCDDTAVWTPISCYKDLQAAVTEGASLDAYYYLTEDILMRDAITPLQNQKLHICLNGHKLIARQATRAFMIYKEGATMNVELTITDCNENPGIIEGGYNAANGANILVFNGSTLNLYNGIVRGGMAATLTTSAASYGQGGNINIDSSSTFNMYGGIIEDGRARRYGGNVYNSGTMNLYGGIIRNGFVTTNPTSYNEWIVGGNVANRGTMTLYGGTISDGKANQGGNIYNAATLTINGTTVDGGEALTGNGGNILNDSSSTLNIVSGTVQNGVALARKNINAVTKTVGQGGNIFVQNILNMTGGTVDGGEANYMGGNIYINNSKTANEAKISGGVVSGGTARIGGNIGLQGTSIDDTKRLTISGTAEIKEGTAHYNATKGDGHGGNIYLNTGAELIVSGGSIHDGKAGKTCGGGNISVTGTGAMLTITDGKIYDARAYATGEKDEEVSSVRMFADVAQIFLMSGGFLGAVSDAQTVLAIDSSSGTDAFVIGGYLEGTIGGKHERFLSHCYLVKMPADKYIATNSAKFTLETAETYEGTEYPYEVARGFMVTPSARTKEGAVYTANLTGGGVFRNDDVATLTAPEAVGPYRFVAWTDGTDKVLSESTTVNISFSTSCENPVALYEFAKTGLQLEVTGTSYTISVKGAKDSAFTTPESFTKATTKTLDAGTEVKITYTGTQDFAAWTNDTKKFVSTNKEYTFKILIDTKLCEQAVTESGSNVQILYMNAYHQLIQTVDSTNVATEIPQVPALLGKTVVGWDKSVTELQEEISKVAVGETKNIIVLPVYTENETEGTVTVGKFTTWNLDEDGLQYLTEVTDSTKEYRGTISKLLEVEAEALNGYTFACFINEAQEIVSYSATYQVRPTISGTKLYAVYTVDEATKKPSLSISFTGVLSEGTVQVDVTRTLPDGYSVVEQGFLLATKAMGCVDATTAKTTLLLEKESGFVRRTSKLDEKNGVSALKLSGLTNSANALVYTRGYLIYQNDVTGEMGTIYTGIVEMTYNTCETK